MSSPRGGRGRAAAARGGRAGRGTPRGGAPLSLEDQQRENQERMNAALLRQGQQGLGPATGGLMSVPTNARSAAARQNAQSLGNPQQVQQLAAHQMYYGRMYNEKTAAEMKKLLPNMHHHEDQTHLLNIMFSVNKQSKRRRATASHAELSSERKYSLKEEELMQALMVHMERKGFTSSFVQAVKAGGADKSVSLPQYVMESAFEHRAQREANEAVFMLLAKEDARAYESQFLTLQRWVGQAHNMYQPELTAVLFPVFVHSFLNIMMDAEEHAQNFFSKHSPSFQPQYGPQLEKLMVVREEHQLSTEPVVQDYLQNKMTVWICRHTFGLLATCLTEQRLAIVLHLLYHYIDLQVFDGNPRTDPREPSGAELLKAAAEAAEHATQPSLWGEQTDVRATIRDTRLSAKTGEEASSGEKGAADTGAGAAAGDAGGTDGGSAADDPAVEEGAAAAASAGAASGAADPAAATSTEDSGSASADKKRARLPDISDQSDESYISTLEFLRRKVRQTDTSLPSTCCYTFRNTHNTLNTLALERHGRAAVGGFDDASVRVWDHTRRTDGSKSESTVLRGHAGAVYGCDFCRDGRFVISTGQDGTARLWSLERGCSLSVYQGHQQAVWCVATANTDPYFVTGSSDHTARLWTFDRTEPVRIFAGHLADVDSVAFHPNCNYVVTGSLDLSLRLWDINTGSCVRCALLETN